MKKIDVNTARREFIQTIGCFAGALAALGVLRDDLAVPVAIIDSDQAGAEKTYPIPAADGVSVDRAAQVILVRANGHVFAFALSCPHQNAAVKWVPQHNQFECIKHDSHYTADGTHVSGRATRNMDRMPIRRTATSSASTPRTCSSPMRTPPAGTPRPSPYKGNRVPDRSFARARPS